MSEIQGEMRDHACAGGQSSLPVPDLKGKYVLLINPPWEFHESKTSIVNSAVKERCYPPLGLALLAGYLESCGARVAIIDMQAQKGTVEDLAPPKQPDFTGITANTVMIGSACAVAGEVKRLWPETRVVMGGIHPTMRPGEVLQTPEVDFVVRGEGERSLAWLVGGADYDQVPGLAYLQDGSYREHPELDLIEDLDAMPMASYHLLPMHLYNPPLSGALRTPSISIYSSRGCPGKCTYCAGSMVKKLRFFSAAKLIREIEYLVEHYGIREMAFYDDTFCANRKRVRDFCSLLIERKIDLTWSCFSRIDYADRQTLELMRKSGCHVICYGVESSDKAILENIKKRLDLEKVVPATRMTQETGIRVRLSFMLGNPGETRQTMENSVRFAIAADPDYAQFLITTPFPGTEMYEWAERHGYLATRDWSKYDFWNVIMKLPTVSEEDIYYYARASHRRFYLRFGFFRRFVVNLFRYPPLFLNMLGYGLRLLGLKRPASDTVSQ
ncbi:MAG: cobalamin-dependent protein [Candidatus Glassbacteria bacterium]|nr:cobalamin-dependent protein [Candidatus Glassbacteria bacterium]